MIKILRKQGGIGLIEVVAALAISIIVITALVSLSLHTLRSSSNNKYFQEATAMATGQVELLRAYRDNTAWDQFITNMQLCDVSSPDEYCILSTDGGLIELTNSTKPDPSASVPIVVYFMVEDPEDDAALDGLEQLIRVEVVGVWNVTGNVADNKETHIYTEFTNWRPNP